MKKLEARSLAAGALLGALLALSLGAQASGPERWEYRILVDVSEKELDELVDERWEFAGYLGSSTRGSSADETLWRRKVR